MTEEQLKEFLVDELNPHIQKVFWNSDGIWAQGPNNTYVAYYKREVALAKQGLYIEQFIADDGAVIHEDGTLYLGGWSDDLKVSLDDDDEIRRRVYNLIKRFKEIKNKERMKKIQKDF